MNYFRSFATLVLLSIIPCGGIAQGDLPESDYYPLKVGTTWSYKEVTKSLGKDVVSKVVKIEASNDKLLARIDIEVAGLSMPSGSMLIDAKGIYTLPPRLVQQKDDVPTMYLRLPPKEGDFWDLRIQVAGKNVDARRTVRREKIKVPAGEFETFKVITEINLEGNMSSYGITWLAKGLGPVKTLMIAPDGRTWILELDKFERGR